MALPFKYYILNEQEIESGALDLRYYTKTQADGKYVLKETGKQLIESAILTDLTDGGNTTLHKHDDKADKIYATNLVTNGDFSNGTTGWGLNGSTISAANNILSITGNGTTVSVGTTALSSLAYASGKKIYSRGKVRVTNSNSNRLSIILFDGLNYYVCAQQTTIINGTWYDISGVTTLSAGGNKLEVMPQHRYVDAATSNGKVMEVQYVLAIDLTAIFGVGNEPTKEQMDRLLSIYPNSWFNGTAEITNIKQVFNEKADRLFATNLVTNGDFSNGTTGWTHYSGGNQVNHVVIDGYCRFVQTATIEALAQNLSCVSGRKYYVRLKAKADNALNIQIGFAQNNVGVNLSNPMSVATVDTNLSVVITTTMNLSQFIIGRSTTTSTNIYVDNIITIDLTTIFGTGKEPTKEQMDWLLAQKFTNSWFNGTQELTSVLDLLTLVNTKANITQEAWITPTLLNGTTGASGNVPQYFKDTIGIVHLRGKAIQTTNGTSLFILPVGYRPLTDHKRIVSANNAFGVLRILPTGSVYLGAGNGAEISLDGLTFRAEA